VPVDCSLQGEEVFVGDLGQPWTGEAQRLMRGHAAAVARFWSPHGRHADAMAVWLDIARDRIAVVPPAVDPGAYPARSTVPAEPIIGHLGVLVWRKGADVVAEAVRRLSRPCTLRFAGQEPNRSYRRQVRRLAPAAAFLGELSPEAKRTFLAGSRLVVLGSRIPEERAMIALESLCMGVPVVAPAAGIVPDLVASGCVRTYAPGDPADLARVLDEALAQPGWDGRDSPAWIAAHHAPQVAADAAEAALAG
jgi:glycosyltransferase involved in cell wall biosynthesis